MQAISPRFAAEAAPAAPRGPRVPYPGLAAALARAAADRLKAAARARFYRSAIARLALAGPLPTHLSLVPDALSSATLAGAQDILRGVFALNAGTLSVRGRSPFDAEAPPAMRAELHRFAWLAHLEKAGGGAAENVARALVEDWLDRFERWRALAWRPDVLGPRLIAWSAHFRFLTADHDLVFRSRLMRALAEQTRHLARSVEDAPEGPARLHAAAALAVMALALPEAVKSPERALEGLMKAAGGALAGDGGVVTRNPADQLAAVAALARVRRALGDAHRPIPATLDAVLARAEGMLSLLRFGDGGLACFHGGDEGDRALVAELARPVGAAFASASLYARLAGGVSALVFDCGGPPAGAFADGAHAAPLSFEFACGDQRLIVNGGVARRRGAEWIDAARRTAAHATLQIGDTDAGAILDGAAARRLGPRLHGGHARGDAAFGDAGGWAEGSHDFYVPAFGATHMRRLFLDPTGEDLRGEDVLTRAKPRGALEIAVRFPLHPDCRASLTEAGDSVLVAPPAGPVWRFRCRAAEPDSRIVLEDGLYMGGESVRRTQAIVVRAVMTGGAWTLRWALKTDSPANRPRQRLV